MEHRRQVEDDERGVEVEARCRRTVEHPSHVACHQPAQLQANLPAVCGQAGDIGANCTGRFDARYEDRLYDSWERGSRRGLCPL